nr:leucine-rich repeat domain-containing protein [Lachnospiraceae bacterium]
MSKKTGKKRRFRLRKRARMTIASLLLVSALIISLIPTQQKTQAYINPSIDVLSLDSVLSDHAIMDESVTSVTADASTDIYMAFPLLEETTVTEYNGSKHTYYSINYDGMTGSYAVPVLKMGTKTVNVDGMNAKYVALIKYVGYNNDYNPDSIDLTKSVCYNSKPEAELVSYYERGTGDDVLYCVEEYSNYEDKLGNNYNILHIKKQTVNYDPKDEEQAEWANTHPDPASNDWIGHFGAKAGSEQYIDNLCFTKSSIDYICDEAFMDTKAQTISIPTELYDLGNRTFKNCSNLTTVRVGNKVKTIGRECFSGCVNLNSLNIDDCSYLSIIADGAFANCAFTSMTLPNNPDLKIGAGAYYGCYNFNDSIDSTMGIFSRYAGTGGSNIVYIGHYAFANCSSLNEMYMYRNLRSLEKGGAEDYTYEGLFAGCVNLKKVVLPSEYGKPAYSSGPIRNLGRYMFQKCNSLEYVRFMGTYSAAPYDDWQFVTRSTLDYAMEADPSYNSITVADSFVIWGENPYPTVTNETAAHVSAKKFSNTYMYYDDNNNKVYELTLGDYMFNFSDGTINSIEPTKDSKASLVIPSVIGDQQITSIADNAFVRSSEYADKLERLTIPDTVKTIGTNAFSG